MRKSEAVNKLVEYAFSHMNLDIGLSDADEIIGFLEKIGMMSPYKEGTEPFGHNEGYIEHPGWEAEEE